MADALVVGCMLITLLRHADRVRSACLAQLVNVIPSIRTLPGGPAWRQTSYWPFLHAARYGRGTVLRVEPSGPAYEAEGEGTVPGLEATAVHDAEAGTLTVFAVNRLTAPLPLRAVLRDLDGVRVAEHLVLADDDLGACNTAEDPDRVVPRAGTGAAVDGGVLAVELPPLSWSVLRLAGPALG
jgi:alpha-N-arabinofuranosidase